MVVGGGWWCVVERAQTVGHLLADVEEERVHRLERQVRVMTGCGAACGLGAGSRV